ncbi:MAG: class I tRNA ligase family protein, partial [Mucilaginibacter sp.]
KEGTAKVIEFLENKGAGKAKINYRMRDAIFGRQRYWGEPVPVYFTDGLPHLISESDLPLLLPEIDKYLPTETGEPPLGRAEDWKYRPALASPKSPPKERTSDEDEENSLSTGEGRGEAYEYELSTMPGWAGSSWYWYRYMDAHNDKEFASRQAIDYWKDVDLYIGGSEHATGHLLYSRFWNKFLKDLGLVPEEEPFKKLINQGHIQGRSNFIYRIISSVDTNGPLKDFVSISHTFVSYDLVERIQQKAITQVELNDLIKSQKRNYNVSFDINNLQFQKNHVPVEFVDNDILDIDKWKKWRGDDVEADADFICNLSGKFVCDWEVEKMSKSKYNVVNPDDIISRHGADTLRMYEMVLGPLEQSKPWNTNGIEGVFKFLRKFWKLFHDDQFNFRVSDEAPSKAELKSLHKIIRKVEEDIDRFSFNTSVSSFMIAVNELTDLKCNKRAILQELVIVLSPYAPHICEELWQLLGNEPGTLSYATYPKFNPEYLIEDEFAYPISINGKMKMNLNISLALEPKQIEEVVLASSDVQKYLDGKSPKKVIVVKGRIVNIVV